MRGTMLWFNTDKNLGVIEAEDGERIHVDGGEFAPDDRPGGRCRGTAVAFRVAEGDDDRHATGVTLVTAVAPRRARRRYGHR